MSPEECIAALDDALAEAGEDVVLRRVVGTGANKQNIDVEVRAIVRNFRLREEDIGAGIVQGVLLASMSPTQIANAQWPGGVVPGQSIDPSHPRVDDKILIKGRICNITAVESVAMGGEVVRYNLQVTG